jgi:hypothetical protein
MKSILIKIKWFIRDNKEEIALVIGVFLISLISFGIGYLTAKEEIKEPIKVQYEQSKE